MLLPATNASLRRCEDGAWQWNAKNTRSRVHVWCEDHGKEEYSMDGHLLALLASGQLDAGDIFLHLLGHLKICTSCEHVQQKCYQLGHLHLEPRDHNKAREKCRLVVLERVQRVINAKEGFRYCVIGSLISAARVIVVARTDMAYLVRVLVMRVSMH